MRVVNETCKFIPNINTPSFSINRDMVSRAPNLWYKNSTQKNNIIIQVGRKKIVFLFHSLIPKMKFLAASLFAATTADISQGS